MHTRLGDDHGRRDRTFNLSLVAVVPAARADEATRVLEDAGERPTAIGHIHG